MKLETYHVGNIATLCRSPKVIRAAAVSRAKSTTSRACSSTRSFWLARKADTQKTDRLLSYLVHVADEYPALYISLLGRLVPIEAKVKTDFVRPQELTADMDLPTMINEFERKIKDPNYQPAPRTIEHDDDYDDDEAEQ